MLKSKRREILYGCKYILEILWEGLKPPLPRSLSRMAVNS